jgi:hypothetical protein
VTSSLLRTSRSSDLCLSDPPPGEGPVSLTGVEKEKHMGKEDEVIDELLERMKEPGLAQKAFEQLASRVRVLRSLTQKQ